MGDIEKRDRNGEWGEPVTLNRYKRFVEARSSYLKTGELTIHRPRNRSYLVRDMNFISAQALTAANMFVIFTLRTRNYLFRTENIYHVT